MDVPPDELDEPLLDEALPPDEALPLDEPDELLLDEALPPDEPDELLLDEAPPLDEPDEPLDDPSFVTPPESSAAPALPSGPGKSPMPRSEPHALAPRHNVSGISTASGV